MRLGMYCSHAPFFVRRHRRASAWMLVFPLILIFVFVLFFFSRLEPVFGSRSEAYATNMATQIMNESVQEVFTSEQISYSDLVVLKENSSGDISAVEADTVKMNQLKAEITTAVQAKIDGSATGEVKLPLGAMLGSELFSGLGPWINVKVAPVSIAVLDFTDSFESVGINQVKHRVCLNANVTVSMICASMHRSQTVTTTIPVAETVIVGNVPNYYANNADMNVVGNGN